MLTGKSLQTLLDELQVVIDFGNNYTAKDQVSAIDADIIKAKIQEAYSKAFYPQPVQEEFSFPAQSTMEAVSDDEELALVPEPEASVETKNATDKPSETIVENKTSAPEKDPEPKPVAKISEMATEKVPAAKIKEPVEPNKEPIEPVKEPEAPIKPEPTPEPTPEPKEEPKGPQRLEVHDETIKLGKNEDQVQDEAAAKEKQDIASKPSANDIVEKNMKGSVLGAQLQQKPLANIASAIGLNDKFQYIRELFDGDAKRFAATVEKLNGMESFEAAMEYIGENFDWDQDDVAVIQFLELVNRRYI